MALAVITCIMALMVFAGPLILGAYIANKKPKARAAPKAKPKPKAPENGALLEALQTQLDATCELALSIDKQVDKARNDEKRAQLQARAAATWVRAAKLQQQIDKLQNIGGVKK